MVEFTVILSNNQSKLMSTINQYLLQSINFPKWMSFGQSYSICSTHFNVAYHFLAEAPLRGAKALTLIVFGPI